MSLVTETGAGLADAESYASVDAADAYHEGRNIGWLDLALPEKEAALRLATDYLHQRFTGAWQGLRVRVDQALDWPRSGVIVDGIEQRYTVLPVQLVRATCEMALKAASQPLTTDETAAVKSEKVGPIEVTYADGARQQTRFMAVENMVRPLLRSGSQGSIRVVRA